MILKGSQRGGARQLAAHLLKVEENEHVEIHEISGFVSEDLEGALREIYAISQGTRCKQFMLSLSLNPPQSESVPVEYFEQALADIEKDLKLEGQPRAIVFHEKEGRRHCHTVWSRIDGREMKAINLPYFKLKLHDISKQLYFQYGWKIPEGFIGRQGRNPLNFTLAEWQQAKRLEEDPKVIKQLLQDSWAISENKNTFEQSLKEKGFHLAKGGKRGFVAIDYRGEVFSLSRWLNVKTKELKNRLGEPKSLHSVEEVKNDITQRMSQKLQTYIAEVQKSLKEDLKPFIYQKRILVRRQQNERQALKSFQAERWKRESIERSQRLPNGVKAIWSRITGKYSKIRTQNELETKNCFIRDREEKHRMIQEQLKERKQLQEEVCPILNEHKNRIQHLKSDIAKFMEMGDFSLPPLQEKVDQAEQKQQRMEQNRENIFVPEM